MSDTPPILTVKSPTSLGLVGRGGLAKRITREEVRHYEPAPVDELRSLHASAIETQAERGRLALPSDDVQCSPTNDDIVVANNDLITLYDRIADDGFPQFREFVNSLVPYVVSSEVISKLDGDGHRYARWSKNLNPDLPDPVSLVLTYSDEIEKKLSKETLSRYIHRLMHLEEYKFKRIVPENKLRGLTSKNGGMSPLKLIYTGGADLLTDELRDKDHNGMIAATADLGSFRQIFNPAFKGGSPEGLAYWLDNVTRAGYSGEGFAAMAEVISGPMRDVLKKNLHTPDPHVSFPALSHIKGRSADELLASELPAYLAPTIAARVRGTPLYLRDQPSDQRAPFDMNTGAALIVPMGHVNSMCAEGKSAELDETMSAAMVSLPKLPMRAETEDDHDWREAQMLELTSSES